MTLERPKPKEIIVKLRPLRVLMGQGMLRIDGISQIGVIEQAHFRWKKKHIGLGAEQLKELKENERLRRAVSDLTLDQLILKEAALGDF